MVQGISDLVALSESVCDDTPAAMGTSNSNMRGNGNIIQSGSNNSISVSSSSSCSRRCRWRLVWLLRNCNKKLLFLVATVVAVLVVYIVTSTSQPISRHIQKLLSTEIFQTYKLTDGKRPYNPRLTWHGGGSSEDTTVREAAVRPRAAPDDVVSGHPHQDKAGGAVLVVTRIKSSSLTRAIIELLVTNKFKYKQENLLAGDTLKSLNTSSKYQCIIFEDFRHYLSLDSGTRAQLDDYMRHHNIGMTAFLPNTNANKSTRQEQLQGYPLTLHSRLVVKELRLVANSTAGVFRVLRADGAWSVSGPQRSVAGLTPRHPALQPLVEGTLLEDSYWASALTVPTAVVDTGGVDGVRRVVVGGTLALWLHKLLLLDALAYTGGRAVATPLQRHILVDVDDIFVARPGIRMTAQDVKAMLEAQTRLRELVPGFTFNLGFSGFYFMSGTAEEDLGDKALIGNSSAFWWFGHMWRHTQPHKLATAEEVKGHMQLNKHFARTYNITVDSEYSVAPHHSGVYPVHEPLYDAWKKVWGVRATSTEEYPHLRPDRLRRGFVHRGIMVMPRQMCGLFTHTIYLDSPEHPQLKAKLDASINGGELYQTIVFNPVTIFMTHMTNYANDRLALHVFEGVVRRLQRTTTLQLRTVSPLETVQRYFDLYPEERDPVWGNPCLDKRHLEIWSPNKSCSQLPDFLVLGPQKTGTTALYTFLGLHPSIRHNTPSPHTFEEVQFFSGKNYYRGLDWYLKAFPEREDGQLMFEKSATYFDSEAAPERVQAMLPDAKLVVLLLPPEKRAYSWYQHQVAHELPAATQHSFSRVLQATDDTAASRALLSLRARCLQPGQYAQHLERWLAVFPSSQLHMLDGEQLRTDPVAAMAELQRFLGVEPQVDYSQLIRFNQRKGFYCQVTRDGASTKCLGRNKGKKYRPMEEQDQHYLKEHYAPHNAQLALLLQRLGHPLPLWLEGRPTVRDAGVGEGF